MQCEIGDAKMTLMCPSLIADHFPSLCISVDLYCERCSPALNAEPVNAFSNLAFLVAASAAWCLHARHPNSGGRRLIGYLILVMAAVGMGSFLFHTVATRWAEWGDVIPILAFILLYLWLVMTRFFQSPRWLAVALLLVFFAVTFYLEVGVPSDVLWGGALYLPTLFAIVAAGIVLRSRNPQAGRALLVAAGVFILAFTARTLDVPMCGAFPLGTHFLWHLLNALLLYLLVRLAIFCLPARVPIAM
jgi:hypothetical protein